ncbi:hypothetical protein Fmac_016464 [Flemingia macrophylla]|uniref:uridine/cytidine kinase n=1 Tax=Flemingia macrophylla TaxID=520843 RepID=A0ABD1MHN8_9FABA
MNNVAKEAALPSNLNIKDKHTLQSNATKAPLSPKQPFFIGVAGGTASGKTTESFYYSLSNETLQKVNEYNFDHPESFDTKLMLSTMEKLKRGQPVSIPNYDLNTHKRIEPARQVHPEDIIILEGILVLHDSGVRSLLNMKIFVDEDSDVRLARRIQRLANERGRNIANVLDQYSRFVKPSFEEFVLPTKKYADIIIPSGGDNDVAIDLIVQNIRKIKGMHTLIRDVKATKHDFVFYSDRLIRLVVEHGLGHLPFTEKQVITPTGSVYSGVVFCSRLCGVSVIRSGESMENALRACCKGIKIGKILIHGHGTNGRQAPQGINAVCGRFPMLKLVTSEIDASLNENSRVIPGLGEFGDRYFATDD